MYVVVDNVIYFSYIAVQLLDATYFDAFVKICLSTVMGLDKRQGFRIDVNASWEWCAEYMW